MSHQAEDRELLELAAKAEGKKGYRFVGGGGLAKMIDPDREGSGSVGPCWNPLTDDGDALRLAHKLGLLSDVLAWPRTLDETRRAIVKAAAEIGRCDEVRHRSKP